MGNAWDFSSISHSIGKGSKTQQIGKAYEIGSHTVSIVWVFFPLDSHPMVYFIVREMHVLSHRFPISWKRQQKPSNGESLGNWFPYFFHSMSSFAIRFPFCGILHHMENAWVSPSIFHSSIKSKKPTVWERTWEIVTHTFPTVKVLFSHRITTIYHMGNAWVSPSISHSIGKCSEIHRIGRAWEIGNQTLPKVWVLFFNQISILWYTLPHGKCMAFLINFP